LTINTKNIGLPWWLSSQASACNAGALGDSGSVPGLGRSPGEGNGNPLQYSSLENPMDGGLQFMGTQSQTQLSDFTFTFFTHCVLFHKGFDKYSVDEGMTKRP